MLFVLTAGCGFSGSQGTALIDDGMDGTQGVVDFLPLAEERFIDDASWTIDANTELDTTTLTVRSGALPAGVAFTMGTQDSGDEVAILRLRDLKINAARTLTVTGTRPLFILSNHHVTIDGTLDVGAKLNVPGPGGFDSGMGPGAGKISIHDNGTGTGYDDSGAGGGSFGTAGAAGGSVGAFAGGAGGDPYELIDQLHGGSSGGQAGVCANPPGAGGGALLLYAKDRIRISKNGVITSGGGGGAGGLYTGCVTGASAGAGGGSGGAIWLQTAKLEGDGTVAANGGGGGGAGYYNAGNGTPGENGKPSTTAVAVGGNPAGRVEVTAGGGGAVKNVNPSIVSPITGGNGGGGGGGLGRIVYRAPDAAMLDTSPAAIQPQQ